MDWYESLYTGDKAKKKKKELIQTIESGKTPFNIYLITLPHTAHNQLEIFPASQLKIWQAQGERKILGLACGKKEALLLVKRMAEDVLHKTGRAEIRSYFETGEGEQKSV